MWRFVNSHHGIHAMARGIANSPAALCIVRIQAHTRLAYRIIVLEYICTVFIHTVGHIFAPMRAMAQPIPLHWKVHLVWLHFLLVYMMHLYRRILFQNTVRVDAVEYISQYRRRKRSLSGAVWYTLGLSTTRLPTPRAEPPNMKELRSLIYECDNQGNPLRCWRDHCKGHWKAPRYVSFQHRMRHCGSCGECRFFLDHHCIWVSNGH